MASLRLSLFLRALDAINALDCAASRWHAKAERRGWHPLAIAALGTAHELAHTAYLWTLERASDATDWGECPGDEGRDPW